MSSPKLSELQQKLTQTHLSLPTLCKTLAIASGLVLFSFYVFFHHPYPYNRPEALIHLPDASPAPADPTNLTHLVFGLVGSMNTWGQKRPYVESWWLPNATRGYIFLDRPPAAQDLPWPATSPPWRVSDDISNMSVYSKFVRPDHMRIVRTVLETFREGDVGVRWYVMADDDTVLFLENLVEVLGGYDHDKYMYVGASSECVKSDSDLSFEMAFGGAGYALSRPLVEVLVTKIDGCLERYPYSWVSDFLIYKCIEDLGVALTHQKGFHQIDLHNDISGLLSAHPQTPLLSLHHIDIIDPIFPTMNRSESINQIMRAASADSSRLLQQAVCHLRPTAWSVSVSWGYSAQIYEQIHPRSLLHRPIETFLPWTPGTQPPLYVFNPRWPSDGPCFVPHAFYFESVERRVEGGKGVVVSRYVRVGPRGLPVCESNVYNNSADYVHEVVVTSPVTPLNKDGRVECCDVEYKEGTNVTEVKLRSCRKDEIIA